MIDGFVEFALHGMLVHHRVRGQVILASNERCRWCFGKSMAANTPGIGQCLHHGSLILSL
jgi:hypothetical protein